MMESDGEDSNQNEVFFSQKEYNSKEDIITFMIDYHNHCN
jgi:hypothetical protein